MIKNTAIASTLSILIVAGCAARPDAIAPASMGDAYQNLPCERIAQSVAEARSHLASLSQQQNNAATGDAVGVFLIGVPMSSLTGGDHAGDIATEKGKLLALESREVTCSYQPPAQVVLRPGEIPPAGWHPVN